MGEARAIRELLGGEPPDRLDSEPLMNEQNGLTNVSAEKRAPRQARLRRGPEGERARGCAGGGVMTSAVSAAATPALARESAASLPGMPTCARTFWMMQGAVRTYRAKWMISVSMAEWW